MENKEPRWKQRFENFEKAFLFLQTIVKQDALTPIEIAGLVQAFEFTFELGWKTIKDYLYEQGIETQYPRQTIKEAFKTNIITDGHEWMDMLEKRNELSHTYNQEVAQRAVEKIVHHYYPAIQKVYDYFKKQEE
jgi:nucleotidyltransferase substrate binding protein (TIGR01987 family)